MEKIAKEWYGKDIHTDWIVKHGCRMLLKNGNSDVLGIFGFADAGCVKVSGFSLEAKKAAKVRLEYGIDYVKTNGRRNRKIFQISELTLRDDRKKPYTKTHSFADSSTRKHYPGIHSLTLIVNGTQRGTLDFEVLAAE